MNEYNDRIKLSNNTRIKQELNYRIALLEGALSGDSSPSDTLGDFFKKEDTYFDIFSFRNAYEVIKLYCEGKSDELQGGTGLK